jgi:hypothetical protein
MMFYFWHIRRGGEYDYQVTHISLDGDKYSVNLLRQVCDCRKWLLTGLPCCHAIACMKHQNLDIESYVPIEFRKERYVDCYSSIIYPANGQNLWVRTEYTDLQPPPIKRQPGRPKRKRRLEAGELKKNDNEMRRATYGIKCSRCKQLGHNKSTCKLPPPPPPPTASANGSTSTQQGTAQSAPTQQPTTQSAPSQQTTTQSAPTQQTTTQSAPSQVTAPTQTAPTNQGTTHSAPRRQRAASTENSSQQPGAPKSKKRKTNERVVSSQPPAVKKPRQKARKDGVASTQPM